MVTKTLAFKFQDCKTVTELLKNPPSLSPYLVINKKEGGRTWQTFLCSGSNSILEASSISDGVAALIGANYLFHFDYPP